MEMSFTYSPSKTEIETIYNGLVEFNTQNFKELNEIQFGVFIRDETGNIVGGATGKSLYTTFHINYFWISESFRFKGLGKELFHRIELEAKKNGALNIFLETYSFQAPDFYKGLGFTEVGRYSDYPKAGIDKIVFQKRI